MFKRAKTISVKLGNWVLPNSWRYSIYVGDRVKRLKALGFTPGFTPTMGNKRLDFRKSGASSELERKNLIRILGSEPALDLESMTPRLATKRYIGDDLARKMQPLLEGILEDLKSTKRDRDASEVGAILADLAGDCMTEVEGRAEYHVTVARGGTQGIVWVDITFSANSTVVELTKPNFPEEPKKPLLERTKQWLRWTWLDIVEGWEKFLDWYTTQTPLPYLGRGKRRMDAYERDITGKRWGRKVDD